MLVKWKEDDAPSLFTVPTSQKNPQKKHLALLRAV